MKYGIPSWQYYNLLEWKDTNMDEFIKRFDARRMCDLSVEELQTLYKDLNKLGLLK